MSFSEEMKKIGNDISATYDIRVSALGDIIKETKSTLKDARETVKNFHTDRGHMSEELHGDLEHFRKELMDFNRKMLNSYDRDHKAMAEEMKDNLADSVKSTQKETRKIMAETQSFMEDFRNYFEKMSQDLRKMLSSYYKGDIQKPVHDMLGTYHKQMQNLASEFKKAHDVWQSFSRSMASSRGKKPMAMKKMSKAEHICSILEQHPKGMAKGMIAKEMGCAAKSLTAAMNSLKKQGRISMKQNKYFMK